MGLKLIKELYGWKQSLSEWSATLNLFLKRRASQLRFQQKEIAIERGREVRCQYSLPWGGWIASVISRWIESCEKDGNPVILLIPAANYVECNLRISSSADG